ncbi:MAG: chemotaxis response regulator protein-glutamate methylesterase [Porticoccaceae bacterium]
MQKIRVLIIDDSAVVRRLLKEILSADSSIEVVGTAMDPYVARRKIKKLSPDVLTLDVEMPKMDGLSFLDNLMRLRPMPVVMVSSQTKAGAETTLKALELGAVDFVCKPKIDRADQLEEYRQEILEKVKAAAQAIIQNYSGGNTAKVNIGTVERANSFKNRNMEDIAPTLERLAAGSLKNKAAKANSSAKANKGRRNKQSKTIQVIAIGASTGGTEAIKSILARLPVSTPPIVVVQHIPKTFSAAFARSANNLSAMEVSEAKDGDLLARGCVYVSPGDRHLSLRMDGDRYYCVLDDGPKVNRHKPSADVMFRSVAKVVGNDAVGILLTGMGADGARGLVEMLDSGALTIAQDQATSVVWGMPGEAVRLGAAQQVLPLGEVADHIIAMSAEELTVHAQ